MSDALLNILQLFLRGYIYSDQLTFVESTKFQATKFDWDNLENTARGS